MSLTAPAANIGAMMEPVLKEPYPVAARKLLRETLLDAARDLLVGQDWGDITMADIAQTAGVSLTAQQPEINIARVAIQAVTAVLGGST